MIKSVLIVFLMILGFQANAQDDRSYIDSVRNHRYILFSWEGTPNREVSRYRNHINNHLSRLDYEVLDSLYHTETGILQFYAFIIICKKFPGKIDEDHKKMLKAKDQIMTLTGLETEPRMLPKKDIATTIYKGALEMLDTQNQTETAVQSFIRN